MILILIFLVAFASILFAFHLVGAKINPFNGDWKPAVMNLVVAAVLAYLFDRGLLVVAIIILCIRLIWEKVEQFLKARTKKDDTESKKGE